MGVSDQWWWARLSPRAQGQIIKLSAPLVHRRRPRWGNVRRRRPFSEFYGYDRGRPVDRMYIERFVAHQAASIRGDVLEIKNADYTTRFGTAVVHSHILDIDPQNTAATITGDICDPGTLTPESFDCVILTQTLQFLPAPVSALESIWRSLRPGGALLLTVPCVGRIDPDLPEADFWRWTPEGLRTLLAKVCPAARIDVESGGNLVAALSALLGLAVEDLRSSDLADDDPMFPVTACARVQKAPRLIDG